MMHWIEFWDDSDCAGKYVQAAPHTSPWIICLQGMNRGGFSRTCRGGGWYPRYICCIILIGWKGTEQCFILMTSFQNETFHLIAEFIMKPHHFTVLCIFHTLQRKHKPAQGQTYCTRELKKSVVLYVPMGLGQRSWFAICTLLSTAMLHHRLCSPWGRVKLRFGSRSPRGACRDFEGGANRHGGQTYKPTLWIALGKLIP